jgi:hypothetical protein
MNFIPARNIRVSDVGFAQHRKMGCGHILSGFSGVSSIDVGQLHMISTANVIQLRVVKHTEAKGSFVLPPRGYASSGASTHSQRLTTAFRYPGRLPLPPSLAMLTQIFKLLNTSS